MLTLLVWLLAVLVAAYGILRLVRGDILVGVILLIVACLIGPGGYSLLL